MRQRLAETLRAAGCANASELVFASLGLNLSDQYWFRPEGTGLAWDEVNYFDNPYCEYAAELYARSDRKSGDPEDSAHACALGASDRGSHRGGPGASTGGHLAKWWERRGSVDYLVKGSSPNRHEPYAEVLATRLYARTMGPGDFVSYELELIGGEPHSVCPCFVTRETEFVPLCDFELRFGTGYPRSRYENYVTLLERLGIPRARTQLAQMLVCDYLTGNADRHDGNLGVIRDVETLEWVGVAPVFDSGRAFYFGELDEAELRDRLFRYEATPFESRPSAQLALVEDFSWFDPTAFGDMPHMIATTFAHNQHLPSWFGDAVAAQFSRRLARVAEAAAEARPLRVHVAKTSPEIPSHSF